MHRRPGCGTTAYAVPAAAQRQGIPGKRIVNIVGQEQGAGMARHVRQRFARIVRIFQHLRVGIAVAGDNVGVLGQRPGEIHLHALRAHAARGFGDGFITNAFGVQHVALVDIKQRNIGGNAVEQVKLSAYFIRV